MSRQRIDEEIKELPELGSRIIGYMQHISEVIQLNLELLPNPLGEGSLE